jgi:two-component system CheB/CheR fusion protein
MFDLFVQGDRSAARTQGGLGVGLTLVRRMVEMHGGTVEAVSEGPGQGSTFTIRLPRHGGERETPIAAASHPAKLTAVVNHPLRILVVDDNIDAAESLALLLDLTGHQVRTAHTGPEALALMPEFQPHAVLLDIGLPGMDGHEVAQQIRSRQDLTGALLIAVTGYGQDADRRRSAEAGFQHHLVKPIDPAELQNLLAAIEVDHEKTIEQHRVA